jgi:hypothetical protein
LEIAEAGYTLLAHFHYFCKGNSWFFFGDTDVLAHLDETTRELIVSLRGIIPEAGEPYFYAHLQLSLTSIF